MVQVDFPQKQDTLTKQHPLTYSEDILGKWISPENHHRVTTIHNSDLSKNEQLRFKIEHCSNILLHMGMAVTQFIGRTMVWIAIGGGAGLFVTAIALGSPLSATVVGIVSATFGACAGVASGLNAAAHQLRKAQTACIGLVDPAFAAHRAMQQDIEEFWQKVQCVAGIALGGSAIAALCFASYSSRSHAWGLSYIGSSGVNNYQPPTANCALTSYALNPCALRQVISIFIRM